MRHLLEYFHLQFWLNIGQEKQGTVAILRGNLSMKACIDTQLRIQGITRIHIHVIACSPTKCLAFPDLKTGKIDGTATPKIQVLLWKIATDYCDQVDLAVERSSSYKM